MNNQDIAKKACKAVYFIFSILLLGEWMIDWASNGCEATQLRALYIIFSLASVTIWIAIEKMMEGK